MQWWVASAVWTVNFLTTNMRRMSTVKYHKALESYRCLKRIHTHTHTHTHTGSPGRQDALVTGQVSAASVVRYTAVKQVRATRAARGLTVQGSIFILISFILSSIHLYKFLKVVPSGFYKPSESAVLKKAVAGPSIILSFQSHAHFDVVLPISGSRVL